MAAVSASERQHVDTGRHARPVSRSKQAAAEKGSRLRQSEGAVMDDHICWIDDTVCEDCAVAYIPLDGLDMTELQDGSVFVVREEA